MGGNPTTNSPKPTVLSRLFLSVMSTRDAPFRPILRVPVATHSARKSDHFLLGSILFCSLFSTNNREPHPTGTGRTPFQTTRYMGAK